MSMMSYKMQKLMLFSLAGFVPSLLFILLVVLRFEIILSLVFSMLSSILFVFMGHKITGLNPFVKAIQEGKVLIIDTPSTGVAHIYNADVLPNDVGDGIDIKTELGDVRAYDRSITNLLVQPFKAILRYKRDEITPSNSKIEVTLTNEEFKNAAWRYQNLTILFFNSQIGSFLTKPLMSKQEKEMLAEYISLNEARELRQLNKTFLSLMRHTFDLIADRFSRIFGNPMFQILIVMVIIMVLGYLALQYMPNITGAATGAVENLTGPIQQPLTIGG